MAQGDKQEHQAYLKLQRSQEVTTDPEIERDSDAGSENLDTDPNMPHLSDPSSDGEPETRRVELEELEDSDEETDVEDEEPQRIEVEQTERSFTAKRSSKCDPEEGRSVKR